MCEGNKGVLGAVVVVVVVVEEVRKLKRPHMAERIFASTGDFNVSTCSAPADAGPGHGDEQGPQAWTSGYFRPPNTSRQQQHTLLPSVHKIYHTGNSSNL